MEAKIQKSVLLNALQTAILIVPKKPERPVFGHIAIHRIGQQNAMTLEANDGKRILSLQMDCDEYDQWNADTGICLPAAELLAFVEVARGDSVNISVNLVKMSVVIHSGRARAQLHALSLDGFPVFAPGSGERAMESVRVPSESLRKALAFTLTCVGDTQIPQANLASVFMEVGKGQLLMAAANGTSMTHASVAAPDLFSEASINVAIASESAKFLVKLSKDLPESSEVSIDASANIIRATFPGGFFQTQVVDTPFLPWRLVLPDPADLPEQVNVTCSEMTFALQESMSVAEKGKAPVTIETVDGGLRCICAGSTGQAEGIAEAKSTGDIATVVSGVALEEIVNAFRSIGDDSLSMRFKGCDARTQGKVLINGNGKHPNNPVAVTSSLNN